ncbi:kinase-like domain-containing protein, partial [Ochromonadaceae sp. CCMP2298]
SKVYKAIILSKLSCTAEKVFVVFDPVKRIQLFRELEALKSIFPQEAGSESGSAYIVRPFEVFANPVDETLSLCLEYMDSGSLEDVVQAGGCRDERVLASIAYQMTQGLRFLHGKRLIHRDVKPSNVLMSLTGCVKLADFGLARTLESGHSLATSFVGTFLYMAPERLIGEGYSFSSDLWSLGLTVLAVAMGRYP